MKYWRGYLFAGIIAACTLAFSAYAKAHRTLVDMIFPYVSRMITGSTAEWSAGVPFCLWQALLVFAVLIFAVLIALTIILKWNFLRVSGWIAATLSLVVFLHVGIFGMNRYAGALADDIHLKVTNYEFSELEDAAEYYLEETIKAWGMLTSDAALGSQHDSADFDTLANQAADGFRALVYEEKMSVFAGSTVPVKKLGWKGYFTSNGLTGMTVNITGEAAVNPDAPSVLLPFAMCREMAHRMSIFSDRDANFAAFLACTHNSDPYFVYSGYLNAYRYCLKALQSFSSDAAKTAVSGLQQKQGELFKSDLFAIDSFYKKAENASTFRENVQLLVSWYVQEVYLPTHIDDEDTPMFDPMDEDQVNLDGYTNNKKK